MQSDWIKPAEPVRLNQPSGKELSLVLYLLQDSDILDLNPKFFSLGRHLKRQHLSLQ